ncbi:hypothetical protein QBC44DRAFT_375678 [Cladorrhinum sp. PSN332]|nr:hypothetical protein QBC44DRAFT_375678 [Cladorrhinum sp. PSN332]
MTPTFRETSYSPTAPIPREPLPPNIWQGSAFSELQFELQNSAHSLNQLLGKVPHLSNQTTLVHNQYNTQAPECLYWPSNSSHVSGLQSSALNRPSDLAEQVPTFEDEAFSQRWRSSPLSFPTHHAVSQAPTSSSLTSRPWDVSGIEAVTFTQQSPLHQQGPIFQDQNVSREFQAICLPLRPAVSQAPVPFNLPSHPWDLSGIQDFTFTQQLPLRQQAPVPQDQTVTQLPQPICLAPRLDVSQAPASPHIPSRPNGEFGQHPSPQNHHFAVTGQGAVRQGPSMSHQLPLPALPARLLAPQTLAQPPRSPAAAGAAQSRQNTHQPSKNQAAKPTKGRKARKPRKTKPPVFDKFSRQKCTTCKRFTFDIDKGMKQCNTCRAKYRQKRDYRIEHNLCIRCGKNKEDPDATNCHSCSTLMKGWKTKKPDGEEEDDVESLILEDEPDERIPRNTNQDPDEDGGGAGAGGFIAPQAGALGF